jgi:hypothetical protein
LWIIFGKTVQGSPRLMIIINDEGVYSTGHRSGI